MPIITVQIDTDTQVVVPRVPSVSNEMKAKFIGEFSWDEEAPYHDERGVVHDYIARHAVPWDLCKTIFKQMTAHWIAAAPQPEQARPSLTEITPHGHEIDAYIEEFLKASGSSFMNYSMASAREKMRDVMTRAMMYMSDNEQPEQAQTFRQIGWAHKDRIGNPSTSLHSELKYRAMSEDADNFIPVFVGAQPEQAQQSVDTGKLWSLVRSAMGTVQYLYENDLTSSERDDFIDSHANEYAEKIAKLISERQATPRHEAVQPAIQYSTDYDALWHFICAGHEALAFVDYRFMGEPEGYKPWRDAAKVTRRGPYQINIGARGISYAGAYESDAPQWPDEKELFVKICQNINLEWASPLQMRHDFSERLEINTLSTQLHAVTELLRAREREIAELKKEAPRPVPTPIPTSERLPTEADADPWKRVLWWDGLEWILDRWDISSSRRSDWNYKFWQPTGLQRPEEVKPNLNL